MYSRGKINKIKQRKSQKGLGNNILAKRKLSRKYKQFGGAAAAANPVLIGNPPELLDVLNGFINPACKNKDKEYGTKFHYGNTPDLMNYNGIYNFDDKTGILTVNQTSPIQKTDKFPIILDGICGEQNITSIPNFQNNFSGLANIPIPQNRRGPFDDTNKQLLHQYLYNLTQHNKEIVEKIEIISSDIITELMKAENADAYFLLPSQFNGAEYTGHSPNSIVKNVAEYTSDSTGGPTGQLTCNMGVAQFIVDNAATTNYPTGINTLKDYLINIRTSITNFNLQNGYLFWDQIQNPNDPNINTLQQNLLDNFNKIYIFGTKNITVDGYKVSETITSNPSINKPIHTVNLFYGSGCPLNEGDRYKQYPDTPIDFYIANLLMLSQYVGVINQAYKAALENTKQNFKVFLMPLGGGVWGNPWHFIFCNMVIAAYFVHNIIFKNAINNVEIKILAWSGGHEPTQYNNFLKEYKLYLQNQVITPAPSRASSTSSTASAAAASSRGAPAPSATLLSAPITFPMDKGNNKKKPLTHFRVFIQNIDTFRQALSDIYNDITTNKGTTLIQGRNDEIIIMITCLFLIALIKINNPTFEITNPPAALQGIIFFTTNDNLKDFDGCFKYVLQTIRLSRYNLLVTDINILNFILKVFNMQQTIKPPYNPPNIDNLKKNLVNSDTNNPYYFNVAKINGEIGYENNINDTDDNYFNSSIISKMQAQNTSITREQLRDLFNLQDNSYVIVSKCAKDDEKYKFNALLWNHNVRRVIMIDYENNNTRYNCPDYSESQYLTINRNYDERSNCKKNEMHLVFTPPMI